MAMEITNNYSNVEQANAEKEMQAKASRKETEKKSTYGSLLAFQLFFPFLHVSFWLLTGVLPLPYTSSVFYQYCYFHSLYLLSSCRQIEDDSSAVYDDDPIAVEPQLDEDELDGDSDESNVTFIFQILHCHQLF